MALKRAMPRVTPVRHFLLMLLFCGTAQAELVRVKFLLAQPAIVSEEYAREVIEEVRYIYRRDFGRRTRFTLRNSYHVAHDRYLALSARNQEFIAYSKHLSRRKRYIKIVLVPPYYTGPVDYGTGLATWFGLAVIRQVNWLGEDRFNSDWITVAHELAHVLGASHTPDHRTDSIMHADALRYADNGLRFINKTRKEIYG